MSFRDIKGQDKAIQILKEHLKNSRLAKSYLFTGPEGVGKKLVAKQLSKAVNCQEADLEPCDTCVSCLKIEKGGHPDIHLIDNGRDEIKIEDIRILQAGIKLRPYEGKHKVFIINNAHNLNVASANAFLKTLEESPGESLIILVTDKPALLPKTIISRCQVIKFCSLQRPELEEILKKDYSLQNNLAHFLAYFCEGRIGRALNLKDADILEAKNSVIDEFALAERLDLENLFPRDRDEMRDSLNILAGWFRDMYLIKAGLPHSEMINLDRKAELLLQMQHFSFLELDGILKFISNALLYLEQNINVKLLQSNLKAELWKQ
ncbi:MAG: DNA polymerase III subunit delta' [Candidatus Omnitrophica bacterium]|nr:DNA polymerase III subunit delta' [Candidatus Omnitrophota bacterium]